MFIKLTTFSNSIRINFVKILGYIIKVIYVFNIFKVITLYYTGQYLTILFDQIN